MTWHQYSFNSNKWPDSVHPPCTFWRNQGHHVSHLKYDFVQSISLPKKMKAFDFVLVLSEGHKEWCQTTGCRGKLCSFLLPRAIWYWDICGGSGPLLESCRPQLRVHKMVHKNHWECHFVHPQGAEKKPVRNEAHHVDLEWFGCVQNGFSNPQMQSLYKMGIVDLMLICVQNGSLVGCSKWGAPTLLHQSSWSQISLYKMWMTNP